MWLYNWLRTSYDTIWPDDSMPKRCPNEKSTRAAATPAITSAIWIRKRVFPAASPTSITWRMIQGMIRLSTVTAAMQP